MLDADEFPPSLLAAARRRFAKQLVWLQETLPAPSDPQRSSPPLPDKAPGFDRDDVQGGIVRAYVGATHGCLLLLAIEDRSKALPFFTELAAKATREESTLAEGAAAVNVAFTYEGLRTIGLSEDELAMFPEEFRQGMEARASTLGDVRTNHPRRWKLPVRFGSTGADPQRVELAAVHLALQVRVRGASGDDAWAEPDDEYLKRAEFKPWIDSIQTNGMTLLSLQRLRRNVSGTTVTEHFGFADGGSDPVIDPSPESTRYPNQVRLGELLLGHGNEADWPPDPGRGQDVAAARVRLDWLKNGSFLVIRKLAQDVAALESIFPKKMTVAERDKALAKMMGPRQDRACTGPSRRQVIAERLRLPRRRAGGQMPVPRPRAPRQPAHRRRRAPRTPGPTHTAHRPARHVVRATGRSRERRGRQRRPRPVLHGLQRQHRRAVRSDPALAQRRQQQRRLLGSERPVPGRAGQRRAPGLSLRGRRWRGRHDSARRQRRSLRRAQAVRAAGVGRVPVRAFHHRLAQAARPAGVERDTRQGRLGRPKRAKSGSPNSLLRKRRATTGRPCSRTPSRSRNSAARRSGRRSASTTAASCGHRTVCSSPTRDRAMQVLADKSGTYSVKGYQERLNRSIGAIYLGQDDSQEYKDISGPINEAIMAITRASAFTLARQVTGGVIAAISRRGQGRRAEPVRVGPLRPDRGDPRVHRARSRHAVSVLVRPAERRPGRQHSNGGVPVGCRRAPRLVPGALHRAFALRVPAQPRPVGRALRTRVRKRRHRRVRILDRVGRDQCGCALAAGPGGRSRADRGADLGEVQDPAHGIRRAHLGRRDDGPAADDRRQPSPVAPRVVVRRHVLDGARALAGHRSGTDGQRARGRIARAGRGHARQAAAARHAASPVARAGLENGNPRPRARRRVGGERKQGHRLDRLGRAAVPRVRQGRRLHALRRQQERPRCADARVPGLRGSHGRDAGLHLGVARSRRVGAAERGADGADLRRQAGRTVTSDARGDRPPSRSWARRTSSS